VDIYTDKLDDLGATGGTNKAQSRGNLNQIVLMVKRPTAWCILSFRGERRPDKKNSLVFKNFNCFNSEELNARQESIDCMHYVCT
jgi:hypothetical protein